MCKEVAKVLQEEQATGTPVCVVTMDGKSTKSSDFVAILNKDNGDASIFYYTDALSMGMAMKMVAKSFVEMMNSLTEEERADIQEVLGEAYIFDSPEEVEVNA